MKDGTRVPWFDDAIASRALADAAGEPPGRPDEIPHNGNDKTGGKDVEVHPLVVHVHAGELLYLPALWLHHVGQRAGPDDIAARAKHRARSAGNEKAKHQHRDSPEAKPAATPPGDALPPLPLIAAVNYWFDISYTNPAVVMLREFGLLL
ncbi:unnamed protein product [Phytomonas sp. Hart1]|nr:unnamed protein product [Phytomonas sp. Hart1]|eukprot:CCW70147.1 unnamed protein product [Phytomonas sp. isolate Hart1]